MLSGYSTTTVANAAIVFFFGSEKREEIFARRDFPAHLTRTGPSKTLSLGFTLTLSFSLALFHQILTLQQTSRREYRTGGGNFPPPWLLFGYTLTQPQPLGPRIDFYKDFIFCYLRL